MRICRDISDLGVRILGLCLLAGPQVPLGQVPSLGALRLVIAALVLILWLAAAVGFKFQGLGFRVRGFRVQGRSNRRV